MKEKHVKRTEEKGITLIALVVTIVVLLILAGVSITVLFGDSGIIKMAQEAADKTNEAAQKDRDDLAELNKYLTSGNWGGTTTPTDPEEPKEPVFPEKGGKVPVQADGKTNVVWKEIVDGVEKVAKIPVGFCVVKDLKDAEGNITDENNITRGLVISDVANDDLDNTAKGNQFVWIPVEVDDSGSTPNFRRIEGFEGNARQSYLSSCQEAAKEGITTTESIAMYQSVADNGGFYIARFEAGVAGTIEPITTKANAPKLEGEIPQPVSKKGVSPWNFIAWGGMSAPEASDGLVGNDNANGAVKVARSMYTKSKNCGVTSTLCYGVQWDAVMQFLEPEYINVPAEGEEEPVPSNSFVRNSSNKGNYDETGSFNGNLALTGSNPAYQTKHIYDLAGNVSEWSMEDYSNIFRVTRGGYFDFRGSINPASNRNRFYPVSDEVGVGFRPALYV